ncbi:MAG: 50S ribosomal protein L11 methyltransferase [Deltaproteobacteria bacterium]|jgi:ribosomal protein L11 methyltransferase|nr:50S ribosomal protein L11 methyltransferase [Deltaproteobacteria bacterium]
MSDEYRRFWITSRRAEEIEALLAEAFEAGAEGAEEVDVEGAWRACVYAGAAKVEAIRSRVAHRASAEARVDAVEKLPRVDWSEAWKEGLEPLRISARLVVRPPFVEWSLEPGQCEVVIDPGQAFGTGAHASTRLALEWIDALYAARIDGPGLERVLDVGTGSGVLALAAVALGAEEALGFDLDPVAVDAAREAAVANGLAERTHFVAGPIHEVVGPGERFSLVVANLLKREILPIAGEVAGHTARSGRLVLSGLLEEDAEEVLARFAVEGLHEIAPRRACLDETGRWVGLCLGHDAA